ncbi:hypothetical protein B1748_17375 [Paenibacillus sp. MY03]|uniref:carbohydrate ABC transporter permease n=1 Tax=Paenibacillus sp. MY03 TaxID=302980 RepID=UPI000B3C5A39|nr:sugar ABC transporter permease [Paenibacillus sp. MY03]OUS75266.1 hypothetical protein B1748_17375 [Paenibacillus sp. MY03]
MKQTFLKRLSKNWSGYIFVSPWVVLFSVFGLLPIIYAIMLSLQNSRVMYQDTTLTLYNYKYLFSDPSSDLLLTIKNTALYVVIQVPVLTFLALLLAFLLNRKLRLESLWKTIFFLPIVTAAVVYSTMWKGILSYDGLLNQLLWMFDLGELRLLQSRFAMPTVAIVDALKLAPYWTIIIMSALTSVSEEVYDSATIDGANGVQKFLRITIPMISPVLFFMVFMISVGAWNVFEQVFVMTQGGPDKSTLTITFYLFTVFSQGRIGMAAAIGIIIGLLVMTTTFIVRKVFNSESHY